MSHISDRWDRGYPFGEQDKSIWHRCLRLWLCLPSNQFLQHEIHSKANVCMLLLMSIAAPPLPPIHLLSSWSWFLCKSHTMHCLVAFLNISVVSTRHPRIWCGSSCWRNYIGIIFYIGWCCVPLPGISTEGMCLQLGLVFRNLWLTADGIRQRQRQLNHSVHPRTVSWSRQISRRRYIFLKCGLICF